MRYNTVVFRIDFQENMKFAEISNFIYKVQNHMELSADEVTHIVYKYYKIEIPRQEFRWVDCMLGETDDYQSIKTPESIRNLDEQYQVIYGIFLREEMLRDVVELQNLYLIKKYFPDLCILGILLGKEDFYHKTSRYFSSVYEYFPLFYEQVYYYDEASSEPPKRLQLKNLYTSRRIMPLQVINKGTIGKLFGRTEDVLGEKILREIVRFDGKVLLTEEMQNLIGGSIKILQENSPSFVELSDEEFYHVFADMNILAFVFFAYFIQTAGRKRKADKKQWTNIELRRCIAQVEQYSRACQQLAENIVFHSSSGEGCLSLRIHSSVGAYVREKYQLKNKEENSYFEIEIIDYSADNRTGNIAENFRNGLPDEEMKSVFYSLTPMDFFGKSFGNGSAQMTAWNKYYGDSKNIGKHFGLKIFENIVHQNNGVFIAESHSGHVSEKNDYFFVNHGIPQEKRCMPGTRYSVIFPMESTRKAIVSQDRSFDSGEEIGKNIEDAFHLRTADFEKVIPLKNYNGQEEKEHYIGEISAMIQNLFETKETDVLYFSVEDFSKQYGEILAKASVLALYHAKKKKHMVFYDCTMAFFDEFRTTMNIFYESTGIEGMFCDINEQIALYSNHLDEILFVLRDRVLTFCLNGYLSKVKGIANTFTDSSSLIEQKDIEKGRNIWIPFDILGKLNQGGKNHTLFEHYTEKVLLEDIQRTHLGCRIAGTHMRLGSTIHIDEFYEAEIIFGSQFFVSRFAYLIVKNMEMSLGKISALTLYGYATYSESLLMDIMNLMRILHPKIDVDYAILEREEERRSLMHTDRIRYSRLFKNEDERKEYFKNRKIVMIVPINSTLKTHGRMLHLFREKNGLDSQEEWVLKSYALILVGSKKKNDYWSLDRKKRLIKGQIVPYPMYFIEMQVDYHEALNCKLCFPEKPVAEIPLIEVNAASTIPNQAFGTYRAQKKSNKKLTYQEIELEEKKIRPLKTSLLYGHIQRKESHFLYYFQTEYLFALEKENIRRSLKDWAGHVLIKENEYNMIVTPLHYSNAGFVELVNEEVFHGACMILRIDFDKEYRSNAFAKYSNIRNFIQQLQDSGKECIVRVHYVDDNIITGRTCLRAKSLVESIMNVYGNDYSNVKIQIFDKIFVLLDRNSDLSRMQYIRLWDPNGRNRENLYCDFYSYVYLNISSLRTYGNSCVLCNLKKEAELLYETSSTKQIADYWNNSVEKFSLHSLAELQSDNEAENMYYRPDDYNERSYRRLACTHIAKKVLNEERHCNQRNETLLWLIKLLNSDYENRENDKFEFFLSYLKVISRPFLVFQKPIKEAVFDLLLVIIEAMVQEKPILHIIKSVEEEKPYLFDKKLKNEWKSLDQKIIRAEERTEKEKKDLISVIMKQLTELKSNYIIRINSMNKIFHYIFRMSIMEDEEKRKEFQKEYMLLIKKLIGISSDTSKGFWLDYAVRERKEMDLHIPFDMSYIPEEFIQWISLENTRVFRDGIEKLNKTRKSSEKFAAELQKYFDVLFRCNEYRGIMNRLREFKEKELENSTDDQIEEFLKRSLQDNMICTNKTVAILKETNPDMKEVFHHVVKKIEAGVPDVDYESSVDQLKRAIGEQKDIYQYHNFYTLLEAYHMYAENKLTTEGAETIACCLGIYQICEQEKNASSKDKEEEIIAKIRKLAILMQTVLHAFKLQVIMEKASNTDWWKEQIMNEFNTQIVDRFLPENERTYLNVNCKRNYLLLADSMGDNNENGIVDEKVAERLNQFRDDDKVAQKGYLIDTNEHYFIWKIGQKVSHNMLFYAELNQKTDNVFLYNGIRNVMMFYNLMETHLFNGEENNVLHELMIARSELAVYNRDKAHSHTKNDVIQSQYKQALCTGEESESVDVYRSHILTLLADLNVSEIYRNSLKPKFYQQKIEYDYKVFWNDTDSIFHSDQYYYVTYGAASALVKMKVNNQVLLKEDSAIEAGDRVLCGSDSKRQFFLLLFSVAMNAAGKERGKEREGAVEVYFSKTSDGNLRIMNETLHNKLDIQKINREIQIEPEREEKGISLWAMSRYIKRVLCRIVWDALERWKKAGDQENLSLQQIEEYRKKVERALSDQFELKVELKNIGSREYFSIEIPVLWEKYEKELCL